MTSTTAATNSYRTQNPATGELVHEFAYASDDEAATALDRAHAAYTTWRETSVADRVALFRRFVTLFEERLPEFARTVTLEMGKPLGQSTAEGSMVTGIFNYYADHAEQLLAFDDHGLERYQRSVTRREAIGVVLAVEPWNGPMYQAMRAAGPNLILGNTIIVKPAEISAGSTLLFDRLFRDAGFPEGVYQTLLATHGQVTSYIEDPRVRAVTFTGSDRTGVKIGEQAGRNLKPVVLELGGSDPFIVLDSADVELAAGTAAACRLAIGGQVCASPKRLILTEGVVDRFVPLLVSQFESQVVGDGMEPGTTLGPLSTASAADLLQEQYQDAVDKGATILLEGGRVDGPGAFFRPAVLTDVTPEMRLYREEAFGPLAVVYKVADAEAAIELANDSDFGLNATVFGEVEEATAVGERLDTGGIGINTWSGGPIEMPFGGVKRSGVGRELGPTGLDAFCNLKSYVVA